MGRRSDESFRGGIAYERSEISEKKPQLSEIAEKKSLSTAEIFPGPGNKHGFLEVCRARSEQRADLDMTPVLHLSPDGYFLASVCFVK